MLRTSPTWQRRFRALWPYAMLTAVLASGLIGLDRLRASQAAAAPVSSLPPSMLMRSAIHIPACGEQLGSTGYSVTLSTAANAAQTTQAALGLASGDLAPEFLPLTSAAPALAADSGAQTLALDRQRMVRVGAVRAGSQNAVVAKLARAPGVSFAEPIYLQSTDKRYLACGYWLEDNTTDQALARIARTALLAHGVSAATLDDTATMEFVSLRHFNGRKLLQVAFVRRVVGTPSVAYVAVLDPGTRAVLATAQANWYLWG